MSNEFSVKDYKIFDDAKTSANNLKNKIDTTSEEVSKITSELNNDSIFMGPICDECIKEMNSTSKNINLMTSKYTKISNYFTQISTKYKNGDANASSFIINLGNKKKKKNSNSSSIGDIDMKKYPKGDSREDGIERATLVAKYLMKNGNFTAEQAAALVGVYVDENNCDPGSLMEAEKNGQGVAGTGGNGYGAGIASWTFEETKRQAMKDAGFDPNRTVESLTLKEQCDMIIAQSNKSNKTYYDALKRCDNIEDASATAVIITGGVGYSDNWDTHPTPAEAKELSDWYGASNDRNFGASPYHWNLDVRRLDYAKQIYEKLK